MESAARPAYNAAMPLPPGLLPESSDTRPSRAPLLSGAVAALALLAVVLLLVQNRRLAHERDEALHRAVPAPPIKTEPAPPMSPPPAPVPEAPPVAASSTSEPPPPAPAPQVRVLPADPEVLTKGLQEFRSGRYDQAERQFFRAIPDSFVYLALTSLAQRNWREAFSFLSRAMGADPRWLRKVNPRDLFGTAADFDALLAALDEQVAKHPIDPDLKTLAAYVRFHEKGAPYAKALLVEATTANPDHEPAKAFLEALGP